MITLTLIRVTDNLGLLFGPSGKICFILEPSWRENRSNVSCIPTGSYVVDYMKRSLSGKYKDCYHIQDVKNRFGILMHKGNTVNHTLGCLLPGVKTGNLNGKFAVLGSSQAMRKIHKVTGRKRFKLKII